MATETSHDDLDRELAELLDVERFDPPAAFVKNALLSDPAIYDEAERDWKGWWERQSNRSEEHTSELQSPC